MRAPLPAPFDREQLALKLARTQRARPCAAGNCMAAGARIRDETPPEAAASRLAHAQMWTRVLLLRRQERARAVARACKVAAPDGSQIREPRAGLAQMRRRMLAWVVALPASHPHRFPI